jgi:hypothetical protein
MSQINFLRKNFKYECPPDAPTLEEMGFDIRYIESQWLAIKLSFQSMDIFVDMGHILGSLVSDSNSMNSIMRLSQNLPSMYGVINSYSFIHDKPKMLNESVILVNGY